MPLPLCSFYALSDNLLLLNIWYIGKQQLLLPGEIILNCDFAHFYIVAYEKE